MRIASVLRVSSLLIAALAALAACAACDSEPRVILGSIPIAGRDAGDQDANRAGSDDEEHDDDEHEEDEADHECSEYEPVCGVDNMTYRNRCQALDAGVNVARPGGC